MHRRCPWRWVRVVVGASVLCAAGGVMLPARWLAPVDAAIAKGTQQQLETGGTNQGGGVVTSAKYRQQLTVGESVASLSLSSAHFRVISGFIGAALSASSGTVRASALDLPTLYAKTSAVGVEIPENVWQKDADPMFIWEAPPTGPDVAGYSYALDGEPDNVVDTTSTSFDVAASSQRILPDGRHTFSVKALNSAGKDGKVRSVEVWIDTVPPHIVTYEPPPSALLATTKPPLQMTVSDTASGISASTIQLFINGHAVSLDVEPSTGSVTATGSGWKEGANSLELRAADVVGNAVNPLIWSVTIDTQPPAGTLTINGGATMTTSPYVMLRLEASDAVSGLSGMMLSNEEAGTYIQEPFVGLRELWLLTPVRGTQRVFVKFVDRAGNISRPVSDEIELAMLSPETVITSGPAGFSAARSASFSYLCPERGCLFSVAVDHQDWSEWTPSGTVTFDNLTMGNHYFRVKAAKEVNGIEGLQPDEEDPTPAERTWVMGTEPSVLTVPKGPPIKVWRLE